MALDPASGRRSVSPESSGRDSPAPRQWRNQLGAKEAPHKDKHYRKYASGVDRALSLFDTALQEWADYISFLNRLLKALQARPAGATTVPSKTTVAKRLSQCLNPSLPSGVHQKTLEVYSYVFSIIGSDGLSSDLPLYLPGLASTLSFASLSVRSPFLDLLERNFLQLDPRSLRLAMKALILTLLPGLEEEASDEFERALRLMEGFKSAVRPAGAESLTHSHSAGDDFFWQCFFLATITSQSRRAGALAYLVRSIPKLGRPLPSSRPGGDTQNGAGGEQADRLAALVTTPEPGLLLRCFAAGLGDEQLLIQRGYLDLLVTNLPLHSEVLQTRAKPADLELLLRSAAGVVIRRDMSLNRRLWSWLLGPEPLSTDAETGPGTPAATVDSTAGLLASRTSYFEEYGIQPLTQALLAMISAAPAGISPSDRARPYRICLSLMDRWEIGGLVVPEVFLPIVDSVRKFKVEATSKADFHEVLRSASVFFDGVESGLIYGEILGLMAKAIGPGDASADDREDKLALTKFITVHFNVREEEMITVHAPLIALAILCMLQEARERETSVAAQRLATHVLSIVGDLLDLVPERAFSASPAKNAALGSHPDALAALPNIELLKKIKTFYVADQGNLDASRPPLDAYSTARLLLQKASNLICSSASGNDDGLGTDVAVKTRILVLALSKAPTDCPLDVDRLVAFIQGRLASPGPLAFAAFASFVQLASLCHTTSRMTAANLSALVPLLVRQAWTFLAASDPKYHVETVRSLWQLQTALSCENHEIEAALSSIMVESTVNGTYAARPADAGRTFAILWTHTLQDTPSASDRKPRTPNGDVKGLPRLHGADNYAVMLTRPLFLMLDALADERTQLFMAVKTWLNSLVGTDKAFLVLVTKLLQLPYVEAGGEPLHNEQPRPVQSYGSDDDVDLGSYYLRSVFSILRWSPDGVWTVLAAKTVPLRESAGLAGSESDVSIQECLVHICIKIISYDGFTSHEQLRGRVSQLQRSSLTLLHQLLLNPYAERLSGLQLETRLIDRLERSLGWPDPYLQVLLLDVVFASLKLREMPALELPTSPTAEKRAMMTQDTTRSFRGSVASDRGARPLQSPPASLLKCLQAGLGSARSRPVLDAWTGFLTECLPLYSETIFQVLIPLVETLCAEIGHTLAALQKRFTASASAHGTAAQEDGSGPESTLISLLNGLEQVLARGHDRLLAEEARAQTVRGPDQPQGFFGNMVSGVFSSDAPQARSATANDRLTVILAFQDAVRICFRIWSWGQDGDASAQDSASLASFTYTSLRMRNRARRLLEHVFAAETLECLETVIGIWKSTLGGRSSSAPGEVLNLLPALDGSRPKHTIPAIFDAIYTRTNPAALDPSRKSSLTVSLQDTDIVIFLVDYARTLEDDAMDEIWHDCVMFLKDLLSNPFPHRQTLPSLLEFAAILGEKVDNTNFGEQRKMRRDLGDLFLRLLTALFTTRPTSFAEPSTSASQSEKRASLVSRQAPSPFPREPAERADDVVGILASIVPLLPKVLVEADRVLTAATTISANVIAPSLRSKAFPDTMSPSTLLLLQELSRLPNNQKTWRKDVADAFNDSRFFGSDLALVQSDWLPLLRQWAASDRDRLPDILARITPPATAGIVFGVGATSARLEADRKTQLNLRRVATLMLASPTDAFVTDLGGITEKVVELLAATATSSPSSVTRSDLYMVLRTLVLKTSSMHLAPLWPIINTELHAAIASVVAPDHSAEADMYTNQAILQACKLLDLLLCVAPDDFQLHEWLFVTDTIDAVYRPASFQPVALADELSEELGSSAAAAGSLLPQNLESAASTVAASSDSKRRLLLGPHGINDDVGVERRDELVAKILRPFFGQLSIFAFESTYAMAAVDWDGCVQGLLRDLFDERNVVKAL